MAELTRARPAEDDRLETRLFIAEDGSDEADRSLDRLRESGIGYRLAATGPAWMQPATELACLCRQRGGEARRATRHDLLGEGSVTRRPRGPRDTLTLRSDE